MLLVNRVHLPVDVKVEPEVEKVLMDRGVKAVLIEELSIPWRLAWRNRPRGKNPGQLDLALDRAVLIEVPEDAVVVVADRRERGDHQPTGAPHLGLVRPHVHMPPEDTVVLLVHADGVLDRVRLAVLVDQRGVEVVNLAQTVAAERERIDQCPKVELTAVEG